MKTIFIVQHSYEVGEDGLYDETKLIGVYSSKEKAESVVKRYKRLPGFKDYLDAFYISEYEIDKDNWTEGFIKWSDANDEQVD
ncbi:hypothetical protein M3194_24045 [Paenibacillus glycanilyticus]|uniref:DUF7336 domain-containing protein n=1 Tax=Paenibacillus glycanilyticus TaxID=126569 RepID=UPI002040C61E|nr:hypothetical protein [Paenibacillus glycanilyticus]MCM3630409.1 hypothetical protein [Paenibacillus glycanilyticus]